MIFSYAENWDRVFKGLKWIPTLYAIFEYFKESVACLLKDISVKKNTKFV